MAGYNPWLHRFALFTVLAALALISVGGLVTSHGAGMAVPDWPNTYGYNMFTFPLGQWVGGILYEHSHRLIAAAVGLLTAILAAWLWARETVGRQRWLGVGAMTLVVLLLGVRRMPVYYAVALVAVAGIVGGLWQAARTPGQLRWLGVVALAAVLLQGVLGGLRVVWLADQIGILHGTLAQLFLVLVSTLALFTSRWWQNFVADARRTGFSPGPDLRGWLLGATLLILLQLALGATMRHQHAGLAIPDFPLAHGQIWPDLSAEAVQRYNAQRLETVALNAITAPQIVLQLAHRFLAVAILVAVGCCVWRLRDRAVLPVLRRLGAVWFGLIWVQLLLGVWTVWSNKAADIATLHVVTGALALVAGSLICVIHLRSCARSPLVAVHTPRSAFASAAPFRAA